MNQTHHNNHPAQCIHTCYLNTLYEQYQAMKDKTMTFQEFVEAQDRCIDIEQVQDFLYDCHDQKLRWLIQCEPEDLRWFGSDYLKQMNFFARLLDYPIVTMADIHKDRRACRVRLELVQLKNDSCFECLIQDMIHERFLCWGSLPDAGVLQKYIKSHGFPKDALYDAGQFFEQMKQHPEHYIHLTVASKATAEYICQMIYQLYDIY